VYKLTKIRFGILGFGLFGEYRLIPAFEKSKFAELIAITKREEKKAKTKAEQYGIPKYFSYSDKDKFLNTEDMDAVFIATPNNLHKQDAIDCFKAGKDVLLEKPMAMNTKECKEIIRASEKYDRKLMIAHMLRYNSTINFIKKNIEEGKLGKIITITADFLSEGFKSKRTWKFNKKVAGGGAAFDLGVHMVDTIRFLTRYNSPNASADENNLQKAMCVHYPSKLKKDEVDLVACFLLEFKNGIIGKATSSFLGKRNLYLEVFGENGFIRAYDWNENFKKIRVEMSIDSKEKIIYIENKDMYTEEIDDFCLYLQGKKECPISGQEGLINQQIIDLVNDEYRKIQLF